MKSINYFVYMYNRENLSSRRWYVDEIDILNNNYDANICVRPYEISYKSDIYFSWWAQSSLPSVLTALLRRKPSIVVAGGSEVTKLIPKFGYNSKNILRKAILKLTLFLSTNILAVSEFNRKEIVDIIGTKNSSKVSVLYHCVADSYFQAPEQNMEEDYILMISALNSNNIKRKCVKECIESISVLKKDFPDIKLIIIGNKEEGHEELLDLIEKCDLGLNVRLLGSVSESEKINYLRNAYCYLQPTFHEQFGVAIAEAMAASCPVISTNVAAVPEVVGDTGILIEENTPLSIAKAIKGIYSDRILRDKLSNETNKRAKELFSYQIKKRELVRLVDRILESSSKKN